jgi:hypothetical protein
LNWAAVSAATICWAQSPEKAMKTIKQTIIEKLQEHGLWPNEAKEVMEMVEADPANESMQGRWGESPEGYPAIIMAAAWMSARWNALEWINKNKPLHFAKGMFETD